MKKVLAKIAQSCIIYTSFKRDIKNKKNLERKI